jgi:hypothetical protein
MINDSQHNKYNNCKFYSLTLIDYELHAVNINQALHPGFLCHRCADASNLTCDSSVGSSLSTVAAAAAAEDACCSYASNR